MDAAARGGGWAARRRTGCSERGADRSYGAERVDRGCGAGAEGGRQGLRCGQGGQGLRGRLRRPGAAARGGLRGVNGRNGASLT